MQRVSFLPPPSLGNSTTAFICSGLLKKFDFLLCRWDQAKVRVTLPTKNRYFRIMRALSSALQGTARASGFQSWSENAWGAMSCSDFHQPADELPTSTIPTAQRPSGPQAISRYHPGESSTQHRLQSNCFNSWVLWITGEIGRPFSHTLIRSWNHERATHGNQNHGVFGIRNKHPYPSLQGQDLHLYPK